MDNFFSIFNQSSLFTAEENNFFLSLEKDYKEYCLNPNTHFPFPLLNEKTFLKFKEWSSQRLIDRLTKEKII